MGLALFETERHERLAGPTSAIPTRPDPLRSMQLADERAHDDVDAVTAIVDQAKALAARHPKSPAAMARLAHAQLATSRPVEARRSARRALKLAKTNPDVPGLVAAVQVLTATGDCEAAEAALAGNGGRSFPEMYARFAIDRRDWEAALARLGASESATVAGLRGWILLHVNRHSEAIRNLRRALTLSPASPDLYINLGYAHAALGALRKAIRATQSAASLSPTNRTAAFNLAAFYTASGDSSSALRVLSKLRRLRPNELPVRLAIAGVHSSCGDYVLAERELRSAQGDQARWSASPTDRAALKANLVALQRVQGKLSVADARRGLAQALIDADYADLGIARLLSGLFSKRTDAPSLAKVLDELSRRHGTQDLAAFRTQLAFLELRFEDALREAEEWIARSPFDGAAATTLTYLLAEVEGDLDAAVRVGRAALQRMPSESTLRNNVVYALIRSQRCIEARRFLREDRAGDVDGVMLATAGLLALEEGNIARGVELYEQGADRAVASGDIGLGDLIRHRLATECLRLGIPPPYDVNSLEESLNDDPRLYARGARLNAPQARKNVSVAAFRF